MYAIDTGVSKQNNSK